MTETTKTELPKINYEGKEYDQEKLSEKARYLFRQLFDIQKKEDTARFTIDQI